MQPYLKDLIVPHYTNRALCFQTAGLITEGTLLWNQLLVWNWETNSWWLDLKHSFLINLIVTTASGNLVAFLSYTVKGCWEISCDTLSISSPLTSFQAQMLMSLLLHIIIFLSSLFPIDCILSLFLHALIFLPQPLMAASPWFCWKGVFSPYHHLALTHRGSSDC